MIVVLASHAIGSQRVSSNFTRIGNSFVSNHLRRFSLHEQARKVIHQRQWDELLSLLFDPQI